MIDKELLAQYADLKLQIKQIEFDLDILAPQVLPIVERYIKEHDGTLPALAGKGAFNVMQKKTWKYSPAYENAQEALKDLQKQEQQLGRATFEEKPILVFKSEE